MPHPVFRWSWSRRRLLLGLRAGCGALYACAWTPLVALCSFIPFSTAVHVVAEVAFYLWQRKKWSRLDALCQGPLAPEAGELAWGTFRRVVQGMQELQLDPLDWLSSWFKGENTQNIHREEIEAFLSSSVWCSTRHEVVAAGFGSDLEAMVCELEARCSFTGLQYAALELSSDTDGASCSPAASNLATPQSLSPLPVLGAGPVADSRAVNSNRFRFKAGSNPKVTFYQQQAHPLPHWYRPAVVYLAFEFMAWMNQTMLTWAGFKHHRKGCVEYYTFGLGSNGINSGRVATDQDTSRASGSHADVEDPGAGADDDGDSTASLLGATGGAGVSGEGSEYAGRQAPLVVLHGVGMGILPYLKLLLTLISTGAPVIAVEYKHVGQRWCGHVPDLQELRDAVASIMSAHGCGPQQGGAHLVAHSFGSVVASALMQSHPQAVRSLSLLDPVCFHMWLPSLLINFIYRPFTILDPRQPAAGKARSWSSWLGGWLPARLPSPGCLLKDLMIMGPAREMHCSAALCRLLDWRQVSMWSGDVPARCIIALAGCDELLPAPLLAEWARKHTGAKVMVAPQLRHADVLVTGAVLDPLVAQIYHLAYEHQEEQEREGEGSERSRGLDPDREVLHVCGTAGHEDCY